MTFKKGQSGNPAGRRPRINMESPGGANGLGGAAMAGDRGRERAFTRADMAGRIRRLYQECLATLAVAKQPGQCRACGAGLPVDPEVIEARVKALGAAIKGAELASRFDHELQAESQVVVNLNEMRVQLGREREGHEADVLAVVGALAAFPEARAAVLEALGRGGAERKALPRTVEAVVVKPLDAKAGEDALARSGRAVVDAVEADDAGAGHGRDG